MEIDNAYKYLVDADGRAAALIPIELLWTEDYRFLGKTVENETDRWKIIRNKTKFAEYSFIADTYATGKSQELDVLYRDGSLF